MTTIGTLFHWCFLPCSGDKYDIQDHYPIAEMVFTTHPKSWNKNRLFVVWVLLSNNAGWKIRRYFQIFSDEDHMLRLYVALVPGVWPKTGVSEKIKLVYSSMWVRLISTFIILNWRHSWFSTSRTSVARNHSITLCLYFDFRFPRRFELYILDKKVWDLRYTAIVGLIKIADTVKKFDLCKPCKNSAGTTHHWNRCLPW